MSNINNQLQRLAKQAGETLSRTQAAEMLCKEYNLALWREGQR